MVAVFFYAKKERGNQHEQRITINGTNHRIIWQRIRSIRLFDLFFGKRGSKRCGYGKSQDDALKCINYQGNDKFRRIIYSTKWKRGKSLILL